MMTKTVMALFLPCCAAGVAFVTIANDDYYARGALVTLHSVGLHTQNASRVLLVAPPGISRRWRRRFRALGVLIADVPPVPPSPAVQAAMEADRRRLDSENVLEVLQPVPYGGAFAKVHAWDPRLFGRHDKVVLLDGDVLAKRDLTKMLSFAPISAARDLMDAFNYGVVVLRPSETVHQALVKLLTTATPRDIAKYNTRGERDAGFCDQTLVAGYIAAHHGPIHFFEDRHAASRKDPEKWLLSTEYNLVVSYRAKERCDDVRERRRVDAARLVHFANNWLHFDVLSRDRSAPGRIDAPRCYAGAFRYWHDVHAHALASAKLAMSPRPAPVAGGGGEGNISQGRNSSGADGTGVSQASLAPKYVSLIADDVSPEEVQDVFEAFQNSGPASLRLEFGASEASGTDEEL